MNDNVIELVVQSTEFDIGTGKLISLEDQEISGTTFMTRKLPGTKR